VTAVKLIHATPKGDELVAYMARVSNPENQDNPDSARLISYLIKHKHWSPFEMVGACVEINTTRDIARQILRHRSFHFQEFSQRYADASLLGDMVERECRMQDVKNRQNSIECTDKGYSYWWSDEQKHVWHKAKTAYELALQQGIAKEQARALLPEGLTPSRMYMHGTLREWIHYLEVRTDQSTQKEHRLIADEIHSILHAEFPAVFSAVAI
jgi:thymidylate synthase (FAD)